MNITIAGLSDIGKNLAELLIKEGHEVTVIEQDPAKCAALAESSDVQVIEGDAGQRSTLEEARVRNAHAFVATAGDDSRNLMICMIAKEMGAKTVVSLIDQAEHAEAFKQAGINLLVNPDRVAAKHIYRMISQPYVKDFLSFETADIFEIAIEPGMKCVGRSVSELATPLGVKVLLVKRGEKFLTEDSKIQPKDWLTLIVNREVAKRGTEFMNKWFAKG
ncbi:MAG: potassium channel family protein [Dehalococcoidia bacterium]